MIKVKSFSDKYFFPFAFRYCHLSNETSYCELLNRSFSQLVDFCRSPFQDKDNCVARQGSFHSIYTLEQLHINFCYICSGTLVSFLAGLG